MDAMAWAFVFKVLTIAFKPLSGAGSFFEISKSSCMGHSGLRESTHRDHMQLEVRFHSDAQVVWKI